MNSMYPQKPVAPDPLTESRFEHTSLRRRMLTGQWHDDLVEEIERHVPSDRARAWGVPDMSSNISRRLRKPCRYSIRNRRQWVLLMPVPIRQILYYLAMD